MLNAPKAVATDALGNIYIADTGNNVVREVAAKTSVISTLAGTGTPGYLEMVPPAAAAQLNAPAGVAVDSSGNVYVADTGNNVVRKISAAGTISTIAGTGTPGNSGDGGSATLAQLNAPAQIAVDAAGDVYVACMGSQSVRLISAAGMISTVAGTGTSGYSGNGGLANAAAFASPSAVAVDQLGNIYVGDTGNNVVRKVVQTATSLSFAAINPGQTTAPQLVTITNFGNQSLTLTALSVPASFIQKATGGLDCTSSTTLVTGGQCLLSLAFSPTGSGPFTGSVTLTDNALGQDHVYAVDCGLGYRQRHFPCRRPLRRPLEITRRLLRTRPSRSRCRRRCSIKMGSARRESRSCSQHRPTGATGTFSNGTNTITVVTGAGGIASATLTAAGTRGAFAVTAKASGLAAAATFNETIAGNPAPTVALSMSPATSPVVYGSAVTLTVTLVGPANSPNSPTGTVAFFDGTTQVGSDTVTNGVASLIRSCRRRAATASPRTTEATPTTSRRRVETRSR